MGKSAILFGSSDSRHLFNFIRIVLSDKNKFPDITIFNTSDIPSVPKYISEYYGSRRVRIINVPDKRKISNRLLRAVYGLLRRYSELQKHLKKQGRYDLCFIHYCAWQSVFWVNRTLPFYKKIIPVTYGGDVLRNKRINTSLYRKFFSNSEQIIFPNIYTSKVFYEKTNGVFESKTRIIQFPKKMVCNMLDAEKSINENMVKKKFNLPEDKYIVICGHTATRAERYEKMITELKKCSLNVKRQCYFVFMMTYAPDDYRPYQQEIESLISDGEINGIVMKEYISYEDIIGLHYISDIHITTILTDAFSCFLQEEMFAGSILIYGKWLHYYEIENEEFYALSIDDFSDLSKTLNKVIDSFSEHAQTSVKNRHGIEVLASEESIKNEWEKII